MADLNEKKIETAESEVPAKAKKAKAPKNKKPNIFVRMFKGIGRFVRDCISEFGKVTWLSRKETWKSSVVVVVTVVALSLLIGILDTVFEFGVFGLRDLLEPIRFQ